jgi:hypothetical protein
VKENFAKLVAFKGMIRKILNMVAAHIEVLMHPPTCFFDPLFCVNVPLTFLYTKKNNSKIVFQMM